MRKQKLARSELQGKRSTHLPYLKAPLSSITDEPPGSTRDKVNSQPCSPSHLLFTCLRSKWCIAPIPKNHTRIAKNLNPTNPPLPTSQIFTHSTKIKSLISPPKNNHKFSNILFSFSATLLAKLALLLSLSVFAWDCYLFLAVLISLPFFFSPFF